MLGDNLRQLRKDRKLTQQNAADFLKVKRVTYTLYELNKREPDNDTLQRLATIQNIRVIAWPVGRFMPIHKEDEADRFAAELIAYAFDMDKSYVIDFLQNSWRFKHHSTLKR